MITVNYNYGNGKLTLYPEKFFPATKGQIRKLYKLFFRIGDRGASAYVDECLQHLDERIPEEEQKTKKDGREKRRLRDVGQEKRQYIHIIATGHEHKNHHKDKHTEIEACGKQLVGT